MAESKEFDELINSFYERNNIPKDSKEEYIYGLRNRLGKFLGQFGNIESEENNIIANCVKNDYLYYSEEKLRAACRYFHEKLLNQLHKNKFDIDDCVFSAILDSDSSKFNSSFSMVSMYITENRLANNLEILFGSAITLENLETKSELKGTQAGYAEYKEYLKQDYQNKLQGKKFLVLIDDFVGSGDSVFKFLKKIVNYIEPNITIIIFSVEGTKMAREYLELELSKLKLKYQISFSHTSGKYFEMQSEKRTLISDFQKLKDPMGYKDTEVVVTTFRNTPNNTITLFWRNNAKSPIWLSLFPRKIKSRDNLKLSEELIAYKKILSWYLTSYCQIKEEDKRKMLTVLFYIENHKHQNTIKTRIELERWICYTDGVIWECQKQEFITEQHSEFVLTELGRIYLQNNKLANISINKIIKMFNKYASKKQ